VSFILDALRKSENDRRRETAPTLAHLPMAAPRSGLPAWVWAVIGTLSLCVFVLAGAWWRSTQIPVAGDPSDGAPARAMRGTLPAADRPATLDPELREYRSSRAPAGDPARTAERNALTAPRPSAAGPALPSVAEALAEGIALPPLELQLVSYSEDAAKRFVFINGFQYRQGQRVQNGPLVVSIHPGRVVLRQQGRDFVLLPN
jgi:general secretion pathway protein B